MQIHRWPDVPYWDDVIRACSDATFFHSRLWHELVVTTYSKYTTGTLGFVLDDGTRAVLPCLRSQEKRLFKKRVRLKSSVFGTYGGIIADRPLSSDLCRTLYARATEQKADITVYTNPFASQSLPEFFRISHPDAFTHVLSLAEGEPGFWKSMSRGARSNLRQAERNGLTFRKATTQNDVHSYINIYRDTLQRWGDKTIFAYDDELFFSIFTRGGSGATIWLVEKDGQVIAGAVVFYCNRIAAYWHGASLKEFYSCYPNNLLQAEIIKDAIQKGYAYYDFGASGGQSGVVRFKESFGARKLPYVVGKWKQHRAGGRAVVSP